NITSFRQGCCTGFRTPDRAATACISCEPSPQAVGINSTSSPYSACRPRGRSCTSGWAYNHPAGAASPVIARRIDAAILRSMIKIESLTLQRGPLRLLENASLTLHAGQKVGLLGTNGAGKSSLFALLLGQLTPDAGDCSLPPDWRIAHMLQEIDDLQRLAVDYVLDGDQRLRQIQRQLAEAEQRQDATQLGTLYAELEAHGGFSADSRART